MKASLALVKRIWFLLVIWQRHERTFRLGTGAFNAEISFFTRQPHNSVSVVLTHAHAPLPPAGPPLPPPEDLDNPEHWSMHVSMSNREG